MTKKIRRTEINIETRKLTVIRSRGKLQVYCPRCQKTVTAFSFVELAEILQMTETGDFHQVQTHDGSFICGNSLENKK